MKLLIVVDMQNDFITGSLGTKEAEAIVDNVADYIKNFKGDVIVTQDTHYSDYLKTPEGRKLPIPHCIAGTAGRDLHYNIIDAIRTKQNNGNMVGVITKNTFGATVLPKKITLSELGEHFYSEIYLCGLCTDICVVSNALLLKAHFPNRKITVLKDLCAGTTPENHQKALDIMNCCQIDIEESNG